MIIRLTGALTLSALASALVLGTPEASRIWAWVITGLQVLGLRVAAGRRSSWGWLLGFSVQPVWIAYAAATDQWGFVLGCVISAAVQLRNYVRVAGPDDGATSSDAGPVAFRWWQWWRCWPAKKRPASPLRHESPRHKLSPRAGWVPQPATAASFADASRQGAGR